MRMMSGLAIVAGGLLATVAAAQTVPPPSPVPPSPASPSPAPLSPPASGRGMMRADLDHDGMITRSEMIADAEARFGAMDTDRNGTVTAVERDAALQAMRAQWRGGGGGRGAGGGFGGRGDAGGAITRAEAIERAGARFDRLDANHDGRLDAAELASQRPMRGSRRGGDRPPAPSIAPTAPMPAPAAQ